MKHKIIQAHQGLHFAFCVSDKGETSIICILTVTEQTNQNVYLRSNFFVVRNKSHAHINWGPSVVAPGQWYYILSHAAEKSMTIILSLTRPTEILESSQMQPRHVGCGWGQGHAENGMGNAALN